MARKLSTIKPRLSTLQPRLRTPGDTLSKSQRRDAEQVHRSWYKTARWQALRMRTLERDLFKCQMAGCGIVCVDTSQLVADHITPHHGDERLFWDPDNLQTLCKTCHDSLKQMMEHGLL